MQQGLGYTYLKETVFSERKDLILGILKKKKKKIGQWILVVRLSTIASVPLKCYLESVKNNL